MKELAQGHTGFRAEPEFRLETEVGPTAPLDLMLEVHRRPSGQGDQTHVEDRLFSLSAVAEVRT